MVKSKQDLQIEEVSWDWIMAAAIAPRIAPDNSFNGKPGTFYEAVFF